MAATRDPRPNRRACSATSGRDVAVPDAASDLEGSAATAGDGRLFSTGEARVGLAWVVATVVTTAVLGLYVHGRREYLLAWVLAGAVNLSPALALSIVAWRRATVGDKRFWMLISIGVALMVAIGLLALGGVLTGWWQVAFIEVPLAVLCVPVFFAALSALVRARSLLKANALDVLESNQRCSSSWSARSLPSSGATAPSCSTPSGSRAWR